MLSLQATQWITDGRFAPYLQAASGDHDAAVELYVWNARISAAIFEVLHHVEVLVRNAIDSQFRPVEATAPADTTWLCDPNILNEASRLRVGEAIERITRQHKNPTRGRVVATLSFGFWRALFDRKYDKLWVSHLHRAFPNGSGNRADVATVMATLVPFRNRLAHHETIIGRPMTNHYDEMLTLAEMIDSAAREWIESVSRVDTVLQECPLPPQGPPPKPQMGGPPPPPPPIPGLGRPETRGGSSGHRRK